MGYTTKFKGAFTLDKPATAEVIEQMTFLEDGEHNGPDTPGRYCQWVLRADEIKWDGNEKFYDYVEWLQHIIDKVLKPAGINIRGTVAYSGESATDHGVIEVADDQHVRQKESAAVVEELAELVRFKDFVLASNWGDEILRAWRDENE